MSDTPIAIPFSRHFLWERVQPKGSPVTIDASAEECQAIAEALGIHAVSRVHAEFTLTPWRKTGFRLVGEVTADVEQECVVTLEPVAEAVKEPVDLKFLPADEIEETPEELEVVMESEDPPEAIEGSGIDLGVLATEFVAIGLDPYPRAPGAEFTAIIEDDGSNDEPESPFASLASLKDK